MQKRFELKMVSGTKVSGILIHLEGLFDEGWMLHGEPGWHDGIMSQVLKRPVKDSDAPN